jgi:hypothetical protein
MPAKKKPAKKTEPNTDHYILTTDEYTQVLGKVIAHGEQLLKLTETVRQLDDLRVDLEAALKFVSQVGKAAKSAKGAVKQAKAAASDAERAAEKVEKLLEKIRYEDFRRDHAELRSTLSKSGNLAAQVIEARDLIARSKQNADYARATATNAEAMMDTVIAERKTAEAIARAAEKLLERSSE